LAETIKLNREMSVAVPGWLAEIIVSISEKLVSKPANGE